MLMHIVMWNFCTENQVNRVPLVLNQLTSLCGQVCVRCLSYNIIYLIYLIYRIYLIDFGPSYMPIDGSCISYFQEDVTRYVLYDTDTVGIYM